MTYQDYMEGVATRLAERFPDRMIYRDYCPVDFQRPSLFLYVRNADYKTLNRGTVEWQVELVCLLYCSTDEYDIESTEELRLDQMAVLQLFGGPALQVGDRHIITQVAADTPGAGEATVTFLARWSDVRPGYLEETAPVMEYLQAEINGKDEIRDGNE